MKNKKMLKDLIGKPVLRNKGVDGDWSFTYGAPEVFVEITETHAKMLSGCYWIPLEKYDDGYWFEMPENSKKLTVKGIISGKYDDGSWFEMPDSSSKPTYKEIEEYINLTKYVLCSLDSELSEDLNLKLDRCLNLLRSWKAIKTINLIDEIKNGCK